MSVYIPGMEMPVRCSECRFFAWSRGVGQRCAVAPNITFHATIDGFDVNYERNGDCPLIPVPDHGRLIDADVLRSMCDDHHWRVWMSDIADAPTIIPADKEAENE